MKLIILVALALVASVAAAPAEKEPTKILRSEYDQKPDGAYGFGFETEDGIVRNENGEVKEVLNEKNEPQKVVVVRGSYEYINPENQKVVVTYVADEFGFKAEGDSIPKATR